jgi:hypothetical protein
MLLVFLHEDLKIVYLIQIFLDRFSLSLPADGRSEYRVQKTQAGNIPALEFLFEDDIESLVVVGDKGM